MKNKDIEKYLSHALKKELQVFPSPSPNLHNRLTMLMTQRRKKTLMSVTIGFATTAIILFFICIDFHQKPKIVDDYFKPTKTVDLNEISFEPTKTIKLDN